MKKVQVASGDNEDTDSESACNDDPIRSQLIDNLAFLVARKHRRSVSNSESLESTDQPARA